MTKVIINFEPNIYREKEYTGFFSGNALKFLYIKEGYTYPYVLKIVLKVH